jgi:hypothetical protein
MSIDPEARWRHIKPDCVKGATLVPDGVCKISRVPSSCFSDHCTRSGIPVI